MDDRQGLWVAYMPDIRGYTDEFMCSNCGAIISIGTYEKECNYSYCPCCGCDMIDNAGEVSGTIEVCEDNRFEIIADYKHRLVEETNIETKPEEMAVLWLLHLWSGSEDLILNKSSFHAIWKQVFIVIFYWYILLLNF